MLAAAVQSHVLVDGSQPRRPRSRIPREGIRLDQHLIIHCSDPNHGAPEFIMEFGTMHYHDQHDLNCPCNFVRGKRTWESSIGLTLSWDEEFEEDVDFALRRQLATLTFGLWLNILPLRRCTSLATYFSLIRSLLYRSARCRMFKPSHLAGSVHTARSKP